MNKLTTTIFIVLIVTIIIVAGLAVYINSANSIKTNILPNRENQTMQPMDHNAMNHSTPNIIDDKTFIEYVIPHHQEAVDSSQEVLKFTRDPELISFLNNVVKSQTAEINMLKGYYKAWFGKDYVGDYVKTKNRFMGMTSTLVEKTYIQNMLGHHSIIIDVAKKIIASDLGYKYKPEIITLSGQIMIDQEADNLVMQKWLATKYR
jgi:uncharacterized protein (DUF305 family)